jgi:tight adherence protein B
MNAANIQTLFHTWRARRDSYDRLLALSPELAQHFETISNALRAGSSLVQAVERITDGGEGPLVEEWKKLLKDIQLGQPLPAALRALEERLPLPPLRAFVTVATVVRETGGNLAGALSTLSQTLRAEIIFRKKVEALTAQGKMSGYIVSAIPFALMAMLWLMAPELMTPLFTTLLGWALLFLILVLVTVGTFIIREIVRIEF